MQDTSLTFLKDLLLTPSASGFEHAIQDASLLKNGDRRTISKQMLYVELDATGQARHIHYAPYLDYRPATGSVTTNSTAASPPATWPRA